MNLQSATLELRTSDDLSPLNGRFNELLEEQQVIAKRMSQATPEQRDALMKEILGKAREAARLMARA